MKNVPFYRPSLERHQPVHEQLEPDNEQLLELLTSTDLEDLIRSGRVSLALIRPNVGPDANLNGLNDIKAADSIEESIIELGLLAKFSFTFTEQTVEDFYTGAADSMLAAPPVKDAHLLDRWEEFKHAMTAGPTTALLLYGDDAIKTWRAQVGHWNIEKNRDIDTIRGKFGVDNYNNLVHGSDAEEAAVRELGIIAECIRSTTDQLYYVS